MAEAALERIEPLPELAHGSRELLRDAVNTDDYSHPQPPECRRQQISALYSGLSIESCANDTHGGKTDQHVTVPINPALNSAIPGVPNPKTGVVTGQVTDDNASGSCTVSGKTQSRSV